MSFTTSQSGVRVCKDFRDNLIVDRYDPIFVTMRASKLKHLRSENSEDAVTWNVFRSLRQVEPRLWVPELFKQAGVSDSPKRGLDRVCVQLWQNVPPPSSLLMDGDEGVSEVDIVLESPYWVWFLEAKYLSDISTGTTTRPTRDQILRNIDVGSCYAGVRDFYFSLLVKDFNRCAEGRSAIERYRNLTAPRELLKDHRPDGLTNLRSVTSLTWSSIGQAIRQLDASGMREDEHRYISRLLEWMQDKGLVED